MKRKHSLLLLALVAALPAAHAQPGKWPEKPVRMVVPFAPGGGTDIVGRMVAVRLSEEFGQHFVVDNRGGAGGSIGVEIVARAAPDGYTLAMVAASYSANPALYKLSFDPVKGIAPIGMISAGPVILVVHPSVKANNLKEFLALARAKPGTLNYGSTGTGGSMHLAFVLFRDMTQTDMHHIPYKGTGPALIDLLSGQIQFMLAPGPAAIPQVKAGKLRALAVSTPKRSPAMPELPAIDEQVPGFEYTSWHGMWATAGTSKEIVLRLNQALARILKRPDVQERLRVHGVEPSHSTPEEFARRLDREIATWKKVVKTHNIKIN